MIRTLATVLAAATIAAVAPAAAEEAPTRAVGYTDLDLATAAGQHTLDARVKSAIAKVCPQPQGNSLVEIREHQKCRTIAMLGSRTQMAAVIDKAQQMAARSDGATRLASR